MTPEGRQKLKSLLLKDESYKQYPYTDTTGHLTIGIGRNISQRGLSITEALYLLDDDILYFSSKLGAVLPVFTTLDEARQIVLIDMCFNLGVNGLLGFTDMLEYLQAQYYGMAAAAMLDSKWADQVGERAERLAYVMRTGKL